MSQLSFAERMKDMPLLGWWKRLSQRGKQKRVRTPTLLQMEAVECGAASLGIILSYYGRFIPLEQLRIECGVSRDGSKASSILKVAKQHGVVAKGFKKQPQSLRKMTLPLIVFWNFNHFLVVEGFGEDKVYLNDPAMGPRVVSTEEFDHAFTGVVIELKPGPDFQQIASDSNTIATLKKRLAESKKVFFYIILASLALLIPGLIIPLFSLIFIDSILIGKQIDWIIPLLIGIGFTAFLRAGLTWLQQSYLLKLETKLAVHSSTTFFWHLLRLPVDFYSQRYASEISARIALNDQLAKLLSGDAVTTIINFFLIFFYAALMLQYDVTLTLIGVSLSMLNLVVLRLVAQKRATGQQRMLKDLEKLLGASIGGVHRIETLKSAGTENDFFAHWAGLHAKVVNDDQALSLLNQILDTVPQLLNGLIHAIVLMWGGRQVMAGNMTVGMLVAFQSLMSSFTMPVIEMVGLSDNLQKVGANLNLVNDVLRYKPVVSIAPTNDEAPAEKLNKLSGNIEIKGLTFGYSKLSPPLISNFNLTIKPGTRVALIGGSGSGKSTIARLVAGLYQPWNGEILFDGASQEDIPRYIFSNSLSFVEQEITLFADTIKNNLILWDETVSEIDLIQATKDACIHNDIVQRKNQYHTMTAEGGSDFSGGQKQRLEIARSLVTNPTIMILDEATSALDTITEYQVDQNIRRRGCTCLIIAHRLSTIRDCDEIIVLDRGRVVQRGTHDSMKDEQGPYRELTHSLVD